MSQTLQQPGAETKVSDTIAAASGTVSANVADCGTVGVQLSGTWVGTIEFEARIGAGSWFSVNAYPPTAAVGVTYTTANGQWQGSVAGFTDFRVRASAYTSGTVTVLMHPSRAPLDVLASGGATTDVSLTEIGGEDITAGAGLVADGTPRVTIAQDDPLVEFMQDALVELRKIRRAHEQELAEKFDIHALPDPASD